MGNPGGPERHYDEWPSRNQGPEVTPNSCWRTLRGNKDALSVLGRPPPTDGSKAYPATSVKQQCWRPAAYEPQREGGPLVGGTEQGTWVDVEASEVRPSDGGNPMAGRTSSS
jgi:hypothetical protein